MKKGSTTQEEFALHTNFSYYASEHNKSRLNHEWEYDHNVLEWTYHQGI